MKKSFLNQMNIGLLCLLTLASCRNDIIGNGRQLPKMDPAANLHAELRARYPLKFPNVERGRGASNLEDRSSAGLNWAVVLVDMQTGYRNQVHKSELQRELEYQKEVIRYCAENDIPIAVLEYESPSYDFGPTIPDLRKELEAVPNVRYFKKPDKQSGFSNPDFLRQLRSWNADSLFFMGLMASECVHATAIDAVLNKFTIGTSRQLILDRDYFGTLRDIERDTNESVPFYIRAGLYSDDFTDFITPDRSGTGILRYTYE